MITLLRPISVPIQEFISVRRGEGHWVKTEADAEGSVRVPLGAVWDRPHSCWTYFEADHDENEECAVCASAEPCVQEVSVYPSVGKILVVHEPMVARAESGGMPVTN
jgi:hypothetical protein